MVFLQKTPYQKPSVPNLLFTWDLISLYGALSTQLGLQPALLDDTHI